MGGTAVSDFYFRSNSFVWGNKRWPVCPRFEGDESAQTMPGEAGTLSRYWSTTDGGKTWASTFGASAPSQDLEDLAVDETFRQNHPEWNPWQWQITLTPNDMIKACEVFREFNLRWDYDSGGPSQNSHNNVVLWNNISYPGARGRWPGSCSGEPLAGNAPMLPPDLPSPAIAWRFSAIQEVFDPNPLFEWLTAETSGVLESVVVGDLLVDILAKMKVGWEFSQTREVMGALGNLDAEKLRQGLLDVLETWSESLGGVYLVTGYEKRDSAPAQVLHRQLEVSDIVVTGSGFQNFDDYEEQIEFTHPDPLFPTGKTQQTILRFLGGQAFPALNFSLQISGGWLCWGDAIDSTNTYLATAFNDPTAEPRTDLEILEQELGWPIDFINTVFRDSFGSDEVTPFLGDPEDIWWEFRDGQEFQWSIPSFPDFADWVTNGSTGTTDTYSTTYNTPNLFASLEENGINQNLVLARPDGDYLFEIVSNWMTVDGSNITQVEVDWDRLIWDNEKKEFRLFFHLDIVNIWDGQTVDPIMPPPSPSSFVQAILAGHAIGLAPATPLEIDLGTVVPRRLYSHNPMFTWSDPGTFDTISLSVEIPSILNTHITAHWWISDIADSDNGPPPTSLKMKFGNSI